MAKAIAKLNQNGISRSNLLDKINSGEAFIIDYNAILNEQSFFQNHCSNFLTTTCPAGRDQNHKNTCVYVVKIKAEPERFGNRTDFMS